MNHEMIALLPVYQPEKDFLKFLASVREAGFTVVVVDDGSDASFQPVFKQAEKFACVLHHDKNRGKGAALKTGLSYIQQTWKEGTVVCVDGDGQHTLPDIWKLAEKAREYPEAFWIGARTQLNRAPLASRIGNGLTRKIYTLCTGVKLTDTQSGLRAFDIQTISTLLVIEGDRYEYEMNQLLELPQLEIPLKEEPIQTVYLEKNSSSHFRRVRDSIRIYSRILKFGASSFVSFLADFCMYSLLYFLFSPLDLSLRIFLSNTMARVFSSILNFSINRKLVFGSRSSLKHSALRYFLLVILILCLNTLLITLLCEGLGWNGLAAKLFSEMIFFFVSYLAQRRWVFARSRKELIL